MTELNLNFSKIAGIHKPTQSEICQIEGLTIMVKALIKALCVYATDGVRDAEGMNDLISVCIGTCSTLELLIDPIIDYMSNYAGQEAAPETREETA